MPADSQSRGYNPAHPWEHVPPAPVPGDDRDAREDVRAILERGLNFNRARSYVKSYPQISEVRDFATATVEEIWAGYERCRANRHLAPQVVQGEKDVAAEWACALEVLSTVVVPASERDRLENVLDRMAANQIAERDRLAGEVERLKGRPALDLDSGVLWDLRDPRWEVECLECEQLDTYGDDEMKQWAVDHARETGHTVRVAVKRSGHLRPASDERRNDAG